jgi:quercetin 2,3-dioxygenase
MGGIFLDQPLPIQGVDQIDPFLLIHHWKHNYKGGESEKNMGVGPHPHRGFSPVTLIFKGGVHHRDSRGNDSKIYAGGTQWMNSGMGIVHSERPVKELAEDGGDFEIIQFWVNMPAKHKMDQPTYQPLSKENTQHVVSEDGKIQVSVIAGKFNDKQSSIKTLSPLLVLSLEIESAGELNIPIPENFHTLLYILDGEIQINSENVCHDKDMVWFNNDGNKISIKGIKNSRAILLAGEPLNETVTSYGPFVMNTQSEILQAMADYQKGKMGVLIEDFDSL